MPTVGSRAAAVAALALLAATSCEDAAQPLSELALEPVVTGLASPTGVAHAGDDRLFVTLQGGRVVIVRDGQVAAQPFLDLTDRVLGGGERGLLSIAFHPRHDETGWFFVDYTDSQGDTVVSRFRVGADADRADPASERVLLRIPQPFANHNGGQLAFGPDDRLYVGTGDGGSAFDPQCHGQNPASLLGKLLRLDVDAGADTPPFHAVPPDNPFANAPPGTARREVWALGLRNPWRFSFDRATGDLLLGDVGQNEVEEIDFAAAGTGAGANYGWKVMEGTRCTGRSDGCTFALPSCGHPSLVRPVIEYEHGGGHCSVTGGFVYRGTALPDLVGRYLYGDYCSGRVWAARRGAGGAWSATVLPVTAPGLTSFGEDAAGELYLVTQGGALLRLVGPAVDPPDPPEPCAAGDHTLCLGAGERFAVRATFRAPGEAPRAARVRPVTGDTGALWFFDDDNLELVVKVIDACAEFGRFWVFAAALTDVRTELFVRDTVTDVEKRYANQAGTPFPPVQDTRGFETCGGS